MPRTISQVLRSLEICKCTQFAQLIRQRLALRQLLRGVIRNRRCGKAESGGSTSSLRKKMLIPAAQRANIQGTIGWHSLRHSYRAWLDETGAPLGVQQKLMRHANISTTMNVCGGALMEAKRRANTSVVQRVLFQRQP